MLPPPLPVELWDEILEESISLPTFLDTDHIPEVQDPFFSNYDFITHSSPWSDRELELKTRERRAWNESTY
jgi:hypothetical protein